MCYHGLGVKMFRGPSALWCFNGLDGLGVIILSAVWSVSINELIWCFQKSNWFGVL